MTKTTHGLAAADVSLYKTASRGYHDRSPITQKLAALCRLSLGTGTGYLPQTTCRRPSTGQAAGGGPVPAGGFCEWLNGGPRRRSSAKVHSAPALVHAAPRDLHELQVRATAAHLSFQTRGKKLRPLSRSMFLECVGSGASSPPRRRRAAGRERHDLPRYVLFITHLQSSSQGQRGCSAVTARPLRPPD